jgi:hypothetical protein
MANCERTGRLSCEKDRESEWIGQREQSNHDRHNSETSYIRRANSKADIFNTERVLIRTQPPNTHLTLPFVRGVPVRVPRDDKPCSPAMATQGNKGRYYAPHLRGSLCFQFKRPHFTPSHHPSDKRALITLKLLVRDVQAVKTWSQPTHAVVLSDPKHQLNKWGTVREVYQFWCFTKIWTVRMTTATSQLSRVNNLCVARAANWMMASRRIPSPQITMVITSAAAFSYAQKVFIGWGGRYDHSS